MNPVLATTSFWQPYLTLEPDEVSEADFAVQLKGLRRDFTVRNETIRYEYAGRPQTALAHIVEFPFSCGERFSLVVDYEPDPNGCSKTLYLADAQSRTRSQMGWWDLARSHPYCLRPEEFEALLQLWERRDQRWRGQELPFLLLCQFVGVSDPSAADALEARAQAALRTLSLPEDGEEQLDVSLGAWDGDYRWEEDAELGWVFTSDDYGCYSLRNRPHANSDEGQFPFTAFREMMAEVQQHS